MQMISLIKKEVRNKKLVNKQLNIEEKNKLHQRGNSMEMKALYVRKKTNNEAVI